MLSRLLTRDLVTTIVSDSHLATTGHLVVEEVAGDTIEIVVVTTRDSRIVVVVAEDMTVVVVVEVVVVTTVIEMVDIPAEVVDTMIVEVVAVVVVVATLATGEIELIVMGLAVVAAVVVVTETGEIIEAAVAMEVIGLQVVMVLLEAAGKAVAAAVVAVTQVLAAGKVKAVAVAAAVDINNRVIGVHSPIGVLVHGPSKAITNSSSRNKEHGDSSGLVTVSNSSHNSRLKLVSGVVKTTDTLIGIKQQLQQHGRRMELELLSSLGIIISIRSRLSATVEAYQTVTSFTVYTSTFSLATVCRVTILKVELINCQLRLLLM